MKRTALPPGWLQPNTSHVSEVCSVSSCVNDNVVDPQDSWQHNGFGVANNPQILIELAQQGAVDLTGSRLFFYSVYECEQESDGWTFDIDQWRPTSRAASSNVADDVVAPKEGSGLIPLGYDVVVFGDFLEHSPLSCNSVATQLRVNRFCLFDTLHEAKRAIDAGKFGDGCEDGIYKIFSVGVLPDPIV